MSNGAKYNDSQQLLGQLSRAGSLGVGEIALVTSPGDRASAWAIKVKSNSSYNVYNVVTVVVNAPGAIPSEIGQEIEAVNLAESFTQTGTLPAGTYAVMSRVGDKNAFCVEP
jgi:hypothetical protein